VRQRINRRILFAWHELDSKLIPEQLAHPGVLRNS
jgi:hypothetical protein